MYCTRHQKTASTEAKPVRETRAEVEMKEKATEIVNTGKRKMQKKVPSAMSENLSALIESRRSALKTVKNKFGNYEHPDTRLVIDKETEIFYGKQQDDGTIVELTINDIEWCKSMKLAYQLPTKLGNVSAALEVDIDDYEEISDEEDDD